MCLAPFLSGVSCLFTYLLVSVSIMSVCVREGDREWESGFVAQISCFARRFCVCVYAYVSVCLCVWCYVWVKRILASIHKFKIFFPFSFSFHQIFHLLFISPPQTFILSFSFCPISSVLTFCSHRPPSVPRLSILNLLHIQKLIWKSSELSNQNVSVSLDLGTVARDTNTKPRNWGFDSH